MATDIGKAFALAALPLALLAASPVSAQTYSEDGIHVGSLEVPKNKSQVVTADRAIARAMIGNPEIADIVPLSDRSIYVLGKSMGTTSLTLYDANGRVLSVLDVSVGPDVDAFRAQIDQLLPGSDIEAHISGESMVLTGLASDAAMVDRAVQIARTYAGGNVVNLIGLSGSQQVMVEVRFAEVKRQVGEDIGVSGFASDANGPYAAFGAGAGLVPGPNGIGSQLQVGSVRDSFGVFGDTFRVLGLDIEAYLNALENKGFAKTLAEPTLIALSGQKASFLAGGEFPIPVVQSGAGGGDGVGRVTVEFKPFGVSLGFTPTVLGDKTINLVVEPEVSSIDPAASIQLNGISIPGLQTRRASTTLELRDGESFAIAGLLQQDFQTTINQVPILGNIPILGALFRSTQFQKGETELLIIVTPRLVKPIRPDQVRLPTDRVADPTAAQTVLMGEPYDPIPLEPTGEQQNQTGDDYDY